MHVLCIRNEASALKLCSKSDRRVCDPADYMIVSAVWYTVWNMWAFMSATYAVREADAFTGPIENFKPTQHNVMPWELHPAVPLRALLCCAILDAANTL